ncbi:hypothetical protein JCM10207_003235 [Rhodosporidiobolus poonsookiae]
MAAPPPPPPPVASTSSSRPPQPWTQHLLTLDNPHPSPLSGTQDLLSLFHLEPLYNTFLRPYLDPNLLAHTPHHLPPVGAESPAASPAPVPGAVSLGKDKGKGKAVGPGAGAGVGAGAGAATPASPAPGAGAGMGLKITLGGIKFGGGGGSRGLSPSPSPLVGAEGGLEKRKKALKMEKGFEWMVGDVLGLPSLPRPPQPILRDLVLNPDPAPCPPLVPFDAQQLRDAFTLQKGGLAGFDMGIWERQAGVGGAGDGERKKKKKKRKFDAQRPEGGGAQDPKKQRR